MTEDVLVSLINRFFAGGWRIAPFLKTADGYIGVKSWPKRAATNQNELQALVEERQGKSSRKLLYGVVPPRGRYIVDIDIKKNTNALQLWRDKVIEVYKDPQLAMPNLVVKTKSGGYHLYYFDGSDRRLHSPVSVFSKDSGIDIRGYTGMVIMPTSIGTEEDWQAGEYTVIRGDPAVPCTVMELSKIIGGSAENSLDTFIRDLLYQLNEVLRNDNVPETRRHLLIPDSLIIPSSNRDNTLYRAARLCRLAGLSQESALLFMQHTALRCETSEQEPTEHWQAVAAEKVRRVYGDAEEMRLTSISQLYDELHNAGTVLLRGVSKSYFYFRHGSPLLRLEPRSRYAVDNMPNVLMGKTIDSAEGEIPIKKIITSYEPRDVAYSAAMYPKVDMPFFEYEGYKYVNTYFDPFAAFEPDPKFFEQAKKYIDIYKDYVLHIVGGDVEDADYLLHKLAWIVQKPFRRLTTATIIYSHTRGSGKDLFMSLLREIVGRRYYMPMSIESLNNPHFSFHDKLVCVASEIQQQANARGTIAASAFMGKIKDYISTKIVTVNEKFQQPYTSPVFTNFFLLSNFELSSFIEPGDRRFDVFHATEEKLDQAKFGALADVTNDGVWLDRPVTDRILRQHIIYALRDFFLSFEVDQFFDRQEARMNEVKRNLIEHQAPPAMMWMFDNLPPYFTEEVAMIACHFCPIRVNPEYVMKQLKELYAADLKPVYRAEKQQYRLSGAPLIEKRDGPGGPIPVLVWSTSANNTRRPVYYFHSKIQTSGPPGDAFIKSSIKRWYELMVKSLNGPLSNGINLPGQKPDTTAIEAS